MLRSHQAIIDLKDNVLRIQGNQVPFLSEHELPEKARVLETGADMLYPPPSSTASSVPSRPAASLSASDRARMQWAGPSNANLFPGAGQRMTTAPPVFDATVSPPVELEHAIKTLVDLGAGRETAIALLRRTQGNLGAAVDIFFSDETEYRL